MDWPFDWHGWHLDLDLDLRLIITRYVWGCPHNFLHVLSPDAAEGLPDYGFCLGLVFWVGAQAAVLFAQTKYGAQFMVRVAAAFASLLLSCRCALLRASVMPPHHA